MHSANEAVAYQARSLETSGLYDLIAKYRVSGRYSYKFHVTEFLLFEFGSELGKPSPAIVIAGYRVTGR